MCYFNHRKFPRFYPFENMIKTFSFFNCSILFWGKILGQYIGSCQLSIVTNLGNYWATNSGIEKWDSTYWQQVTSKLAQWLFNSVCGKVDVRPAVGWQVLALNGLLFPELYSVFFFWCYKSYRESRSQFAISGIQIF